MSRQELTLSVADFLRTQPVEKAWLFGSYARGDEHEDSDVDLLVRYDKSARISLWTITRIMIELEKKIHRRVNLVEEGRLIPEAATNVEREKILIYERESSR